MLAPAVSRMGGSVTSLGETYLFGFDLVHDGPDISYQQNALSTAQRILDPQQKAMESLGWSPWTNGACRGLGGGLGFCFFSGSFGFPNSTSQIGGTLNRWVPLRRSGCLSMVNSRGKKPKGLPTVVTGRTGQNHILGGKLED